MLETAGPAIWLICPSPGYVVSSLCKAAGREDLGGWGKAAGTIPIHSSRQLIKEQWQSGKLGGGDGSQPEGGEDGSGSEL